MSYVCASAGPGARFLFFSSVSSATHLIFSSLFVDMNESLAVNPITLHLNSRLNPDELHLLLTILSALPFPIPICFSCLSIYFYFFSVYLSLTSETASSLLHLIRFSTYRVSYIYRPRLPHGVSHLLLDFWIDSI